jgi:hypothetical protein
MGPANTTQAPSFLRAHSNLVNQKKNCTDGSSPHEGPKGTASTEVQLFERGPRSIALPTGEVTHPSSLVAVSSRVRMPSGCPTAFQRVGVKS